MDGVAYIVIGPGCWGKGMTPALARINARRRCHAWVDEWHSVTYRVTERAYVNDHGRVITPDGSCVLVAWEEQEK